MDPSSIVLEDELGELDTSLLLHPLYEAEQLAVVRPVATDEVGRTAYEVMAVLGTTHQLVQLLAAVARGYHDGLAPRFADGVEQLLHEHVQQMVCTLGRAVIDALTLRRGAGC